MTTPQPHLSDNKVTRRMYAVFIAVFILMTVSYIFRDQSPFIFGVFVVSDFAAGTLFGVIIALKVIIMLVRSGMEKELTPVINEMMRKIFPEMAGPDEKEKNEDDGTQ